MPGIDQLVSPQVRWSIKKITDLYKIFQRKKITKVAIQMVHLSIKMKKLTAHISLAYKKKNRRASQKYADVHSTYCLFYCYMYMYIADNNSKPSPTCLCICVVCSSSLSHHSDHTVSLKDHRDIYFEFFDILEFLSFRFPFFCLGVFLPHVKFFFFSQTVVLALGMST